MLAFLLGTGVATVHPAIRPMAASSHSALGENAQKATHKPTSATTADNSYDSQAEQQLLVLANEARRHAGVQPLTLDSGLSEAARIHARAMLEAQQLSHQFPGESPLPQRLAARTKLRLDQDGENVALDYDAKHGHEHLMHSPPHRANLLNSAYNVIGLGVVRGGDRLYIVEDFGHALPSYSIDEVKERVASSIQELRHRAGEPDLARHDLTNADDAACSMAQAGKLGTASVRKLAEQSTVLTYTSLHPESLPTGSSHAIITGNLHSFSVGACYSKSDAYPTGAYWIVLSLQ